MIRRWTPRTIGALVALTVLLAAGPAFAQGLCDSDPELPIVPVDSDITIDTIWTNDNVYVLRDVIYVRGGATLTIEQGTIVRGVPDATTPSVPNNPGTLVITRDSKIYALGTAREPIVFTDCNNDNLRDFRPGLFPYDDLANVLGEVANWGGLIVLGRTYVANNSAGGPNPAREVLIEGLEANGECSNDPSISCTSNADCGVGNTCDGIGRGFYGNCSAVYDTLGDPCICDDDDSGSLRYLSISHGGFNLSQDNEINGLTLGAVGRETDVSYIEVFQSKDDGFEFFGGTVSPDHLVVANTGDDGFDTDEGFRGKLQYLLLMQGKPGTDQGDKGAEMDGGNSPDASRPIAIPTIYNATYVGLGAGGGSSNTALHFRDNTGFRYYNSAFLDFRGAAALVEGATDSTFPRDPALGTAANTSGERAITAFPPAGEDACFYAEVPTSATQLELRDNTFWCIGRQEMPGLAGTLPSLGYCSNVGPGTRNCLDDADCGVGNTCVDKPLDYGISSGDVNKVHFDPGWLA
ncbi:MAG TPA: hypothetical protein VD788_12130, partial [Candidatus Polarisedimenticolaceae bacterium]|nr:hypothetical protein [Candidatus Polarisedimenticolaceae bacterium]